jgi:hypothetical protein
VALAALTCTQAWGQSTAQISGTVRDQSGAILPGADVSATQTATGAKRTAVTNETGSYILPNLPVGPYMIEVELPGFRTYVQTGIVLQVGSSPEINAVLSIGQVAEAIEVIADAALVETRSTGVGRVIDNQRVLELPLNGRQATELIFLSGMATPGTGATSTTTRNYPTIQVAIAGGLATGVAYNLDGANINDPYNGLNLPIPFPDALQEFKVETSGLPAQYGTYSSAAVNAITKSGTNVFHGGLFEFVRNQVFNARNTFAARRDPLKRNQFGGTIGGPIVENKLFFFTGFQGTTMRAAPYGAMGAMSLRGPRSIQIDMGLTRSFPIREGHSLQFRMEAFNVPNLVNLRNPVGSLNSVDFGKILDAGDPRIMQAALKYAF